MVDVPTPQPPGIVQDVQRVIIGAPSAEDRALVKKYESQIITIMDMDPAEKATLFEAIGYDPDVAKNKPEYAELQKQNWQNDKNREAAMIKVRNTTLGTGVASFGILSFAAIKRVFGQNNYIAVAYTALFTMASTLITYFAATKVLTKETARKGKELSIAGRNAEVVEIARALDKRDMKNAQKAQDAVSTTETPAQSPVTMVVADTDALAAAGNKQHAQMLENMKTPATTVPPLPSFGERVLKADTETAQMTTTR